MCRSLIWTIRKPSSDSGQRSSAISTRCSAGGRRAERRPKAPATSATAATRAARTAAAGSPPEPPPEAASAALPVSHSSASEKASRTTSRNAKPIQSDAGQETTRETGGRTRRSANG